jgi:hypothetical protein
MLCAHVHRLLLSCRAAADTATDTLCMLCMLYIAATQDKESLFAYPVDWAIVKAHSVVSVKMRPWIVRKVRLQHYSQRY